MKQCVMGLVMILIQADSLKASAQAQEAEQLKLNVEKLAQLKNILSDLKKGYQIIFNGYTTIRNISQGNFNLHNIFLDGLLDINPIVKRYKRVGDIISTQLKIVKEYKAALRQFNGSHLFTPDELSYLTKVYTRLFDQGVKNLEALAAVITAGKLRMSDDERISTIDSIYKDMEDGLVFLRHFNDETKILALGRAKERSDVAALKKLYSIN